jgi:multidrug efflux pump
MPSRQKIAVEAPARTQGLGHVTQYREGIEHIDVVARAVASERLELDRLPALTIATRNGVCAALADRELSYEYEEPILWRRNRDLGLTVRGDVVDGGQPPDVSNAVAPKLKTISDALRLPHRDRRLDGGSAKANTALVAGFPLTAIAMLAMLMIQLQSFSRIYLPCAAAGDGGFRSPSRRIKVSSEQARARFSIMSDYAGARWS